jgi:diaminohydroxyphosphoribosylaminopyrimidine deaminase/5-amino-6-(5-phosphoribosylamino)uracil reductase
MASQDETAAMRRAIVLSRTSGVPLGPNPRVGAVLLGDDGVTIAEGYHRGAGSPHAEVDALARAGHTARGATAVVTLEPCNHTGRTGPCAQALFEGGVRRVVYAQADDTPRACGGAASMRAAGIDVEGGVLADDAAETNHVWSFAVTQRRPFVTWKFAATLDGRSSAADGTSKWITGPEARADVHERRRQCDAVLVGTGTVLTDNPRLTVRDADGVPAPAHRQPLRAVMGLRPAPAQANVLDGTGPSTFLRTRDPSEALATLYNRDCQHVWLEGGHTLAAAFLVAGLVDEVVAYLAPALLGAGSAAVADLGITTIVDALRFELDEVARLGGDLRLVMKGIR